MTLRGTINNNLIDNFVVSDIRDQCYEKYICDDVHGVLEFEVWETIMTIKTIINQFVNEYGE